MERRGFLSPNSEKKSKGCQFTPVFTEKVQLSNEYIVICKIKITAEKHSDQKFQLQKNMTPNLSSKRFEKPICSNDFLITSPTILSSCIYSTSSDSSLLDLDS